MSSIINYFYNFLIGSFIGFLCETIWCVIRWKKLESRKGLIYGYLIPIYGLATVVITFLVELLNVKNSFLYFLLTYVICAIVEYISSIFQEKCFNTKSWDYTGMKGNINGRINALYLIAWSLIGVVWCNCYEPLIGFVVNIISKTNLLNEITLILFILLLYDCFISFEAARRQKLRRQRIKAKNKFEEYLDKKYNDKVMNKIYANAKVIR